MGLAERPLSCVIFSLSSNLPAIRRRRTLYKGLYRLYTKSIRPFGETVMSLTDLVTIRLPAGKRSLYEKEAAHCGQSLSTYLRERLKKSESSSFPKVSQNIPPPASPLEQWVLVEILLLLRCLSTPEKMRMVQKEMKRLNIPLWQWKNFSKR